MSYQIQKIQFIKMKNIKNYENFFQDRKFLKDNDIEIDSKKVFKSALNKVRKTKDFILKKDKPEIDTELLQSNDEFLKDIRLAIKNFEKFYDFFYKYNVLKNVNGYWSDFTSRYGFFIDEYGYYPNKITSDLINSLNNLFYHDLSDAYGGYISKDEKYKKLYEEQKEIIQKINSTYNEMKETTNKYNL